MNGSLFLDEVLLVRRQAGQGKSVCIQYDMGSGKDESVDPSLVLTTPRPAAE